MSSESISRVYSTVKKMAERKYEHGNPAISLEEVITGATIVPDPFAKLTKPRRSAALGDVEMKAEDADVARHGEGSSQAAAAVAPKNKRLAMEDRAQQEILNAVGPMFSRVEEEEMNGHAPKEGFKPPKVPSKRRRVHMEEGLKASNGKVDLSGAVAKKSKKGHGSSSKAASSVKWPEGSHGKSTPPSGGEGKRDAIGGGKLRGAGGFDILS